MKLCEENDVCSIVVADAFNSVKVTMMDPGVTLVTRILFDVVFSCEAVCAAKDCEN